MPRLSNLAFKAVKSFLGVKLDVWTPVGWSNSLLVA